MYHQVLHSDILHGAHIAFMYFVRISQQTATFSLHNISRLALYNRGGVFTARYGLSPYIQQKRLFFKGLMSRIEQRFTELATSKQRKIFKFETQTQVHTNSYHQTGQTFKFET